MTHCRDNADSLKFEPGSEIGYIRAASPNGEKEGLTCIHRRIHCGATEAENELDQIAIGHFIDTLAEIAQAVARRRQIEQ